MEEKKNSLYCFKCNVPLEEKEVNLYYMSLTFHAKLPVCPICDMIYLSEELARGKAAKVEMEMEDK